MFDKGFLPDIRTIIQKVPKKRQTLIFSATMPKEIRHLADRTLTNPLTVQIDHKKPIDSISHILCPVAQKDKPALLQEILKKEKVVSTLVFTRTKHKAKKLAAKLFKAGFRATSLQGNLSQQKRRQALDGFKSGRFNVMVATDIAARGIDVSGISHVVNFDVPDTAESYTHRTGRTGRATRKGEAYTLASGEDDRFVSLMERTLGERLSREIVPGFEGEVIKARERGRPQAKGRKPFHKSRKKNGSFQKRKARSTRGRAVSFDFGISA
jgi:superfamily II DNA/RNA helicase